MKVKELIEILQAMPQDIDVAYRCWSEQCLMEPDEVSLFDGTAPRPDGWIQNARPDMEVIQYVMFPGN